MAASVSTETYMQQLEDTWALIRHKAGELQRLEADLGEAHHHIALTNDQLREASAAAATKEEERAAAVAAIGDMKAGLESAIEARDAAASEAADLRAALEADRVKVAQLQDKAIAGTEEREALRAQVADLTSKLEAASSSRDESSGLAEELATKLRDQTAALGKSQEALKSLEAKAQSDKAELNRHLVNIMDEMKDQSDMAAAVKREQAAAVSEAKRLRESNETLAAETAEAVKVAKAATEAQDVLTKELKEVKASAAEVEAQLQGRLEDNAKEVETLASKVANMENRWRAAQRAAAKAQQEANEAVDVAKAEGEAVAADARARLAQVQLEADEDLRREKKRTTEAGERLAAALMELDATRDKVRMTEDSMAEARKRLESKTSLADQKTMLLQSEMEAMRARVKDITQERDELLNNHREGERQRAELRDTIATMQEKTGLEREEIKVTLSKLANDKAVLQKEKEQAVLGRTAAEVALRRAKSEAQERVDASQKNSEEQTKALITELKETRNGMTEMQRTIAAMTKDLTSADAQVTELTRTNRSLQDALSQRTRDLEQRGVEVAQLQMEKETAEHKKEDAEAAVQREATAKEEAQRRANEIAAAREEVVRHFEMARFEFEQRGRELSELQGERADMQDRAAQQIVAYSDRATALEAELEALNAETDEAKHTTESQRAETERLTSEVAEVRSELLAMEERAHIAEASAKAAKREVEALRDAATRDSETAAKARSSKAAQAAAATEEARKARADAAAVRRDLAAAKSQVSTMQRKLTKLQHDNESLKAIERDVSGFMRTMSQSQGGSMAMMAVSKLMDNVSPKLGSGVGFGIGGGGGGSSVGGGSDVASVASARDLHFGSGMSNAGSMYGGGPGGGYGAAPGGGHGGSVSGTSDGMGASGMGGGASAATGTSVGASSIDSRVESIQTRRDATQRVQSQRALQQVARDADNERLRAQIARQRGGGGPDAHDAGAIAGATNAAGRRSPSSGSIGVRSPGVLQETVDMQRHTRSGHGNPSARDNLRDSHDSAASSSSAHAMAGRSAGADSADSDSKSHEAASYHEPSFSTARRDAAGVTVSPPRDASAVEQKHGDALDALTPHPGGVSRGGYGDTGHESKETKEGGMADQSPPRYIGATAAALAAPTSGASYHVRVEGGYGQTGPGGLPRTDSGHGTGGSAVGVGASNLLSNSSSVVSMSGIGLSAGGGMMMAGGGDGHEGKVGDAGVGGDALGDVGDGSDLDEAMPSRIGRRKSLSAANKLPEDADANDVITRTATFLQRRNRTGGAATDTAHVDTGGGATASEMPPEVPAHMGGGYAVHPAQPSPAGITFEDSGDWGSTPSGYQPHGAMAMAEPGESFVTGRHRTVAGGGYAGMSPEEIEAKEAEAGLGHGDPRDVMAAQQERRSRGMMEQAYALARQKSERLAQQQAAGQLPLAMTHGGADGRQRTLAQSGASVVRSHSSSNISFEAEGAAMPDAMPPTHPHHNRHGSDLDRSEAAERERAAQHARMAAESAHAELAHHGSRRSAGRSGGEARGPRRKAGSSGSTTAKRSGAPGAKKHGVSTGAASRRRAGR